MTFDAQSFLDASVSGANDTKIIPVPVGEYFAIIQELIPGQWQSKDGTKAGYKIDITWSIEDSSVKEFLGRDNVTVRQSIMLDTDESGRLDIGRGKNVSLGRLREAVNKNNPGDAFAFSMLPGLSARVSVSHREYNGDVFAEVRAVARA